ncbi:MAG: class I SAM-dependent methyltransferase [Pseudomonadales bacterium]|nr:class I SAM-dependent methyltransferase [Pseudomonadales bacterium]
MTNKDTTHFGYQSVDAEDKEKHVADVFDSAAIDYDIMNDVMTGGFHRLWKRFTVELSGVHEGHSVLDLAGGTGDLSFRFSRLVGPEGRVVLADINNPMLRMGQYRSLSIDYGSNISFVQANAENIPFASNSFDCIVIGFGWRNVTNKQKALDSIIDSLKPGGRLLVLEFSKPEGKWLNKIYDAYSFKILPKLGQLMVGEQQYYRYTAESIRLHPDQKTVKRMMQKAGFRMVQYHNLSGGVVAVHRGFKG